MESRTVNYKGIEYNCRSEFIETSYGPEIKVEILDEDGNVQHRSQEAMTVLLQVAYWVDSK